MFIIGIACGVAIPFIIGFVVLIVCLLRARRRRRSQSLIDQMRADGNRKDRVVNSYSKTEMLPLRDHPHDGDDYRDDDLSPGLASDVL